MSKTKPAPLAPGTSIGGYRIVRLLSTGGFGLVYLALDADGHEVAIKEYLPAALVTRRPGERRPTVPEEKLSLYRLGLRSFFEEGRVLAQISHPAVVEVLHFFRENDTVYLVIEYLRGASLQDFIVAARGRGGARVFREGTILSLFDSVLRGLRVVHQHSLLHLDIKPANIFITDDDRAVLIDFGAAREVLRSEGSFVRPMYTPGFAAPELYHRGARPQLGPWTDLYAIGACMYACMRGQPPCEAVLRRDKDRLAVSLTRLRRVYSNHLVDLVQWCMALDPASRPSSVFALQRELIRVPWPADHPPTATGARRRWPLPLRWIMRRIDSVLGPKNPSAA